MHAPVRARLHARTLTHSRVRPAPSKCTRLLLHHCGARAAGCSDDGCALRVTQPCLPLRAPCGMRSLQERWMEGRGRRDCAAVCLGHREGSWPLTVVMDGNSALPSVGAGSLLSTALHTWPGCPCGAGSPRLRPGDQLPTLQGRRLAGRSPSMLPGPGGGVDTLPRRADGRVLPPLLFSYSLALGL